MEMKPSKRDPGSAVAAAVELLVRQGYSSTSVDELAHAAGISRSTFFRKFGSKEDMVFADHERILARVDDQLSTSSADPLAAIGNAALMVFAEHVHNRETSLLRNRLLHQVQMLRDRELVTTHRYERAFRQYLLSALPEGERRDYGAVAFAAAVVAVHNRILRQWLRDIAASSNHRVDQELTDLLRRELRALTDMFRPSMFPSTTPQASRPAVVITVVDPGADTEQIVDAVREALS